MLELSISLEDSNMVVILDEMNLEERF